jgi:predicted Zn-dependent protease
MLSDIVIRHSENLVVCRFAPIFIVLFSKYLKATTARVCTADRKTHCGLIAMISTRRRLEYASGFIELGMMAEAAAELEKISPADRDSLPVLNVRLQFFMAAKEWPQVVTLAAESTRRQPNDSQGWIFHAYALRELSRIAEAQAVLLLAEPLHGATCGVLHYNLACYACLLGNKPEARRRLALAAALDQSWLDSALDDPDLASMREEIRAHKKA